jgi:hypothetical protein
MTVSIPNPLPSTPLLCYLSAASHSGSTLLAMLLNSHPRIASVGELKLNNLGDLTGYRCSCRELIADCPFWKQLVVEMSRGDEVFRLDAAGTHLNDIDSAYVRRLLRPLHRGRAAEALRDTALALSPAWRRALPRWQDQNRRLIRAVSKASGCDVVVDSSKIGIRLKYLNRIPDQEVRVIRLVRDGRAVALTYIDAAQFADAKDPTLRGGGFGASRHRDLTMQQAAREWRRSNEEAMSILASLDPGQYIQVRYEDLCRDVDGTLAKIFAYLGLENSDRHRQFKNVEHHVVGNGMRLDSSSAVVLDDRWQSALDESQLREFDMIAGDLNRSLGYS